MNLSEAIEGIQYDSSWGIWADVPFTPDSEARYGQRQFENGGVLDDMVFFADGMEVGNYVLRYVEGDNEMFSDTDWIIEAAELMVEEWEETRT